MKIFCKLFMLIAIFGLVFIGAKKALAVTVCETQYGGGETCREVKQVMIDKKVFDPENNKFVDNLGINNFKFAPEDEIRYKLIVKNLGNNKLTNLKIKDNLQEKLIFINGPISWNGREMVFTVDNLEAGESKEFEIRAKSVSASNFYGNQVVCQLNNVSVYKSDSANADDSDSAQICIENKVLAKVTPVTGPSVLPIAFFASLILFGLISNKKKAL